MYSPRSSGRGNTLFILNLFQLLDDYTILLDQYVNLLSPPSLPEGEGLGKSSPLWGDTEGKDLR